MESLKCRGSLAFIVNIMSRVVMKIFMVSGRLMCQCGVLAIDPSVSISNL